MRWTKVAWMASGAVLAWLMTDHVLLAQCAMCKIGLVGSPEGQKMASGFNAGILFLMSVPFLTVGTVALLVSNARRRYEQKHGFTSAKRPAQLGQVLSPPSTVFDTCKRILASHFDRQEKRSSDSKDSGCAHRWVRGSAQNGLQLEGAYRQHLDGEARRAGP